ncbi:MAG: diaminopimelate decarboxylase [Phycisphaerae bacterium]|nr:diaminopimelate decarboxylase [Phycisphaerae bacterium]
MDHFQYKNNELYCEEVPVGQIAGQVGTPVYIYSAATLKHHFQSIQAAFSELDPLICYSVKGCSNINILRQMSQWGSGFDVVSGGELFRVLKAGGGADKVVYAGVGKTDDEIRAAIEAGIAYFNIESEAELENLIDIATDMKREVHGALRINPDVDPETHRYTTTGKKETKFGVDIERGMAVFETYGRNEYVKLTAIHLHIGSPVNSTEPYVQAIEKALVFIETLRSSGFTIDALDLGGGFGADYVTGQAPNASVYAAAIVPLLRGRGLKLILEPGRSISGNAGVFITEVLYTKRGGEKEFVIVDGAMNDLIRPMLYDAFHFIWPIKVTDAFATVKRTDPVDLPGLKKTEVVGGICESSDYLAKDRMLPPVQRGEKLCVFTAGAYGFAMSSQYNSRPRAAEVLVDGSEVQVIRRRETYDDLIEAETM